MERNGEHIRFVDSSDSTIGQLRVHMADHFPNSLKVAILDPRQYLLYAASNYHGPLLLLNDDDTIGEYVLARPAILQNGMIHIRAERRIIRDHLSRLSSSRKTRKVSRTRRNRPTGIRNRHPVGAGF